MILAIDPGLTKTGWTIFRKTHSAGFNNHSSELLDYGVIDTTQKKDIPLSLKRASQCAILARELHALLERFRFNDPEIGIVACEAPTGGAQSASALRALSLVAGTIVSSFTILEIDLVWITPAKAKYHMCGDRKASKVAMIDKAKELYPLKFDKVPLKHLEHIADSIGVYRAYLAGEEEWYNIFKKGELQW
jgi:Holliday junction resolvasome RuvABC endonuclease subunit